MGVQRWCLCAGGRKSERMKGNIFCSKGPAMATVRGGTGFLIHKAMLLTTHATLPSVSAADGAEIQLHCQSTAKLVPQRFFITSSVLDLTIVGFDIMESDSMIQPQQPHPLKTCSSPCLDLGSVVYLLGHTDRNDLLVGEGKVVIATDNLIKVSTDGVTWRPGSAGFDAQGNLAFMICDPMKLASSPTTKSPSTSSSSSSKKDHPTQFGIPIPIICQWLKQHLEGSLDELSKPRIPVLRLMSGPKSEPSSASFTRLKVFKSAEEDEIDSSSLICSEHVNQHASVRSTAAAICQEETRIAHEQRIQTPEIYESPKLIAEPIREKENLHGHLLDINFPQNCSKGITVSLRNTETICPRRNSGTLIRNQQINHAVELSSENGSVEAENTLVHESRNGSTLAESPSREAVSAASYTQVEVPNADFADDAHTEVQSNSPVEYSDQGNVGSIFPAEYSSEGETMYSAETRESRNYSSPREKKLHHAPRSQSCVSYSQWGKARRNSISGHFPTLEKQQSLFAGRKTNSLVAPNRTHDYFSPTVSSIMKKRNSMEQHPTKSRMSAGQLSPRWMF